MANLPKKPLPIDSAEGILEIGYKDDFDTLDWMQDSGLDIADVIEMPANNMALVGQKFG